jgi:tape measure domain-containing protein
VATESLIIQINEKGALVVKRNIADIGKAAQGGIGPVEGLKRALAGISVLLLAKQVLQLADSFATLQNKLRVVTNSQEELTSVTQSLFEISQDTRSSFEATAELYSRLSISSRELGLTQQQVLGFTESLNQAVILSGATAQEAEAAIRQLTQGIASGALRGDELRSVLENLPTVADTIAKSLGVTRGELRELGQQGKITAQDIIIAFQEARGELREGFGKTVPTIGQAFTVLRNALLKVSEANLAPLTDAIIDLADTISDPSFQEGFGNLVAGLVKIAGLAFEGLSEFGSFGKILGDMAANAVGVSTEIDKVDQELSALQRALTSGVMGTPIMFLGWSDEELTARRTELEKLREELKRADAERLGVSFSPSGGGPTEPAEIPTLTRPAAAPDEAALSKQADFLQGLRDQAAELTFQVKLGDDAAGAISRYNLAVELAAQGATPALVAQATELNEEIIRLNVQLKAQEEAQKAAAEQTEFLASLEAQTAQLQFQTEAADFTADALQRYQLITQAAAVGDQAFVVAATEKIDALIAQQKAADELREEQEDAARIIEQNVTPQEDFNRQLERAIELYGKGKLTATEYAREVLRLQTELVEATDDLDPALESMNTFLKRARENAQDILGDTLANLFTDGLDDVPEKFADMLRQLAAQYLASEIFRILGNKFGGGPQGGDAGGGAAGSFLGMLGSFFAGGFASGGSFTVPGQGGIDSQMAMMKVTPGEKVTVQTPSQARSGQGSAAPVIVQSPPATVVVVDDPDKAIAAMQGARGESVTLEHIRRNPELIKQMVNG